MGFFSRIYQKVIVSIDLDLKTCNLRIYHHNDSAKKLEEKTYKTVNADLPIEAAKHIRHIQNRYPHTYIATMARTPTQGLINGNRPEIFTDFSLNISDLHAMLVQKKWFVYIAKSDMQSYKNKFNKVVGADFIFSPFVVVYERIKHKLSEAKKLYILQEKGSTTLLIADKDGIYFGNYIILNEEKNLPQSPAQAQSEEAQAAQSDIIEFDSIEDIDENIIIKDFESLPNSSEAAPQVALGELAIANHMIEVIKDALNSFYKDDRYSSDFIDELLLLDGYGINDSAITYLKNNTMIETHYLRIDICEEIEKLAKMELGL